MRKRRRNRGGSEWRGSRVPLPPVVFSSAERPWPSTLKPIAAAARCFPKTRLPRLPPSSAEETSANLTPASGRQDHTTSPSAGPRARLSRHLRPSHPAPHVRDDRETPLVRNGTVTVLEVIWVKREAEYFCKWGWTGNQRTD